ncbi:MAG: VTT domain-containing protein [Patescibacteria group bacterium]|mgnify:CR=1
MKELKKYLLVGGAVLFSVLIFIFRDKLTYLQNFGYVGIFFLSLLGNATVILPVPAFLTALVGGAVFNPFIVGIVAALGATIGELTGYYAGVGGSEFVKTDEKIVKIQKWMEKYGLWTIFFLAAIPNPAFDLAGMVAGASKIPVWKYLLVVFPGKLIKFIIIAYAGSIF